MGAGAQTLEGFKLSDILSSEEIFLVQNPNSKEARDYVFEKLTSEERAEITTGKEDEIILAFVDNLRKNDLERLDNIFLNHFVKKEWQSDYSRSQVPWMKRNAKLCGCFSPDQYRERHQNHKRFRVFYAIKYPERIKVEWDWEYGGKP